MSLGEMTKFCSLVEVNHTKDSDGFQADSENVLARVRCFHKNRSGREGDKNDTGVGYVTDIFRIRRIPGVRIGMNHVIVCDGERYNIVSIVDANGHGMYYELNTQKVVMTGGQS